MPRKPRRSRQRKSKYLFVVATEGYRTEPIYFHYFNPEPGGGGCRFDVLNHRNKNHPDELIDRLVAYRDRKKPGKRAEYWAVFDKDEWSEEQLDGFCARARREKIQVALSNPCFELWLYLHLAENRPFVQRREIDAALAGRLGSYHESDYEMPPIALGLQDAIRRAEDLDTQPDAPWPRQQGTRTYRLMQAALKQNL